MSGSEYSEETQAQAGATEAGLTPEERLLQTMVKKKIIEQVEAHLQVWTPRIAAAAKSNAGKISVGLKADLSFHGKAGVKTSISFTPEKISHSLEDEVDPRQEDLFE